MEGGCLTEITNEDLRWIESYIDGTEATKAHCDNQFRDDDNAKIPRPGVGRGAIEGIGTEWGVISATAEPL